MTDGSMIVALAAALVAIVWMLLYMRAELRLRASRRLLEDVHGSLARIKRHAVRVETIGTSASEENTSAATSHNSPHQSPLASASPEPGEGDEGDLADDVNPLCGEPDCKLTVQHKHANRR